MKNLEYFYLITIFFIIIRIAFTQENLGNIVVTPIDP